MIKKFSVHISKKLASLLEKEDPRASFIFMNLSVIPRVLLRRSLGYNATSEGNGITMLLGITSNVTEAVEQAVRMSVAYDVNEQFEVVARVRLYDMLGCFLLEWVVVGKDYSIATRKIIEPSPSVLKETS